MAESIINVLVKLKVDLEGAVAQIHETASKMGEALNAATGNSNAGEVSSDLRDMQKAAKEAEGSLNPLAKAAQWVSSHFTSLARGIEFVTHGFLALQSVRTLKEFADVAARAETLEIVLMQVGKNAGYTTEEMEKADKSIQKLGITAASSRESLTHLIQAGLDVSLAGPLARASQDLAVIAGWNSSDTFQRLIVNIQQMDSMGLRFMGIMVNKEAAIAQGAQTVGRALNENEKKLAFANAVLLEAAKLAGTYEAAMASVGKQLTSTPRYVEEAKEALGDTLLPVYTEIVLAINHTLASFTHFYRAVQNSNEAAGFGVTPLGLLANAISFVGDSIQGMFHLLEENAEAIAFLGRRVSEAAVVLGIFWAAVKLPFLNQFIVGLVNAGAGVITFSGYTAAASVIINTSVASVVAGVKALAASFLGLVTNPVVLTLVALGLTLQGLIILYEGYRDAQDKALIPSKLDAYSESQKKLSATLIDLTATQQRNQDLALQIKATKAGGTEFDLDALRKEQEIGQARQKDIEKEIRSLSLRTVEYEKWLKTMEGSMTDEQKEHVEALHKEMAELQKKYNDIKDASANFDKAMSTLGLSATGLSKKFADLKTNVETVVAGLERELKLDNIVPEDEIRNTKLLQDAFSKLAEGAKGPDEIRSVIVSLGNSLLRGTQFADALHKSLLMKGAKDNLQEIEKLTAGFAELMKASAEHGTTTQGLFQDQEKRATEYQKALFDLGVTQTDVSTKTTGFKTASAEMAAMFGQVVTTTTQAKDSLSLLGGSLAKASDFGRTLSKSLVEAQNAAKASAATLAKLAADNANVDTTASQRKANATAIIRDEQERARAIQAIDRETLTAKLTNLRTAYDSEKSNLAATLQLMVQHGNSILSLREEIRQLGIRGEQDLLDIQRAGMSEKEVQYSKEKEARDLISKQAKANAAGDYETAKAYGAQRIALEKELAETQAKKSKFGLFDDTAYKKALADQSALLAKKEKEEQAAFNAQQKSYEALGKSVDNLSSQIAEASKQKFDLTVQLSVDQKQIDAEIARIKTEADKAKITIPAEVAPLSNVEVRAQEAVKKIEDTFTQAFATGTETWKRLNPTVSFVWDLISNKQNAERAVEDVQVAALAVKGVISNAMAEISQTKATPGVEASQASLVKMQTDIKTAIENVKADVSVTVKTAQARAFGGLIWGSGSDRSDNIDVKASPGEYVVQAPSVRKLGLDFMNAINLGIVPVVQNFAGGGFVRGIANYGSSLMDYIGASVSPVQPVQAFAYGGPVQAQDEPRRDVVDLNIRLGKESFQVQGQREQVKGLVNAMKSLNRSL